MDSKLTPAQKRAFTALRKAFKRCDDAGILLTNQYGSIMALNKEFFSEVIGNEMTRDGDISINDISAPTIDRADMVSWADDSGIIFVRPWEPFEDEDEEDLDE